MLEAQDRGALAQLVAWHLIILTGSREELRREAECQELCVKSSFSIQYGTLRHTALMLRYVCIYPRVHAYHKVATCTEYTRSAGTSESVCYVTCACLRQPLYSWVAPLVLSILVAETLPHSWARLNRLSWDFLVYPMAIKPASSDVLVPLFCFVCISLDLCRWQCHWSIFQLVCRTRPEVISYSSSCMVTGQKPNLHLALSKPPAALLWLRYGDLWEFGEVCLLFLFVPPPCSTWWSNCGYKVLMNFHAF